jgi:hypothetical protein
VCRNPPPESLTDKFAASAKSKSTEGLSMLEQLKAKAKDKDKEDEEKQKSREKTT